ncbi:MAG: hypothetical protein QXQ94_06700 [Candidatus Bathyarchaeia archaeon]
MYVVVEGSMVKEGKSIKAKENKDKPFSCAENEFSCQFTNLIKATKPISAWDFRHYFWEAKSETRDGILQLLSRMVKPFKIKIDLFFKSEKYYLKSRRKTTPTESLNLKPGEFVEVKSIKEILKTLDSRGRNRGLEFMPEMLKYCGKRFRVFKRVDKMIDATGRIRPIHNTVILDGVTCDGSAHRGCQKTCFCLWREIWLKRVGQDR